MKTDNQVALEIVETVKSFKIYMTKRPLKNWICKKVTDKNHYIFNLMGDPDAKSNLRKPNAIMESRLTVFDHVRVSTRRKTSDLKYLSIIA